MQAANLKKMFRNRFNGGAVHAHWFSGKLRASNGRLIQKNNKGFSSKYEKELLFLVKKGSIDSTEEISNKLIKIENFFWFVSNTPAAEKSGPYCLHCLRSDPYYPSTAKLVTKTINSEETVWFCEKCKTTYDLDGRKMQKPKITEIIQHLE